MKRAREVSEDEEIEIYEEGKVNGQDTRRRKKRHCKCSRTGNEHTGIQGVKGRQENRSKIPKMNHELGGSAVPTAESARTGDEASVGAGLLHQIVDALKSILPSKSKGNSEGSDDEGAPLDHSCQRSNNCIKYITPEYCLSS